MFNGTMYNLGLGDDFESLERLERKELALAFIDELLEGGGNFIFKRTDGGASLAPASDRESDLISFQNLVHRVRANEGDGYAVHLEHTSSDVTGGLVDLMILTLDN